MVVDTRGAVEALSNMDFIDSERIIVAGYSLGAMAGLYTAALDNRIAAAVSVAGFTPMRTNTSERGTEGIRTFSHLHGLQPRLGFFVGSEAHIPVDFNAIIAAIAQLPVFVIAPESDKDAHPVDVRQCIGQAAEVYTLYQAEENLQLDIPKDINRFSPEMRETVYQWLPDQFNR